MKKLLFITFVAFSSVGFAQDAIKIQKNLKVTVLPGFDKSLPISFDKLNPEKHGFEEIQAEFKLAFAQQGFIVNDKPRYLFILDYGYLYSIPRYRMQYSNLSGQVVDLENNRQIVATFSYDGKFEINALPIGVAVQFKNICK